MIFVLHTILKYIIITVEVVNMGKKTSVTVRLDEVDAEKFKQLSLDNKSSQADFLVELMKIYGNSNQNTNLVNKNDICLLMFRRIARSTDDRLDDIRTRKYIFSGSLIYYPPSWFIRPIELYANTLAKEFNLDVPIEGYIFRSVVNVFKDDKKDKYLAQEVINVSPKAGQPQEYLLWVQRICFVDGFEDIKEKFKTYIDPNNLRDIEMAMAEDIGDNTEVFNEYF
jgi:hypothetical protein